MTDPIQNGGDDLPLHISENEKTGTDDPPNIRRITLALYAVCAFLVVIDPLVHKHGPFEIEHIWGFYALYAFVSCAVLVIGARTLRIILIRPEDYYDK